jgi:2-keto-4-pentenoate hydratase/2-oxohepta-3-ene-1,7-dioic acid hydratase in catechol pathway
MKIIAVGRNYADHISELKNEKPDAPVLFLKPDTALLLNNAPFYYPPFSNEIHYEVEVLVKICKEGKFIEPQFAHLYYEEIGLGIDFTARDLQAKLKAKGLPWEIAKAFNQSAVVSSFIPKQVLPPFNDLHFSLKVNGELKQEGHTANMIFSLPEVIAYASQFFTLKKGDIIFTGTPAGVGAVAIGNKLQGFLQDRLMLNFEIK